jgi:hypothetical protein
MVLENRKKVLYVEVLKAIYSMLEAAVLWQKTFRKDLEDFTVSVVNVITRNYKL